MVAGRTAGRDAGATEISAAPASVPAAGDSMSTLRRRVGPLVLDVPALIVGVQILLKAWEKLEHHHALVAAFLALLGGAVVAGAVLTLWLEKRTERAHALFHLAEGVAIGVSALVLFGDGRLRIPLVLLLLGACYLVIGGVESQPRDRRARLVRPLLACLASAFLGGGVLLAGFTAFGDRSIGAFIVAALLAGVGAALLALPCVPRLRSWVVS